MGRANLGKFAFIIGLATTAGAAGCFLTEEDVGEAEGAQMAPDTSGDVSQVLKSTLVLDGGCVATRVGPKHLLLAARCVVGNDAFKGGKTITFKGASSNSLVQEPPKTAANTVDAGASDAAAPRDAGAAAAKPKSNREATIKSVKVHDSYTAKCGGDACAFGAIGASDAKDIAVLMTEDELDANIPVVPVDLDQVGEGDPVLAVVSGCSSFDGTPSGLKTVKGEAAPAKAAKHTGSPYKTEPQKVNTLGNAYVVTPGVAWKTNGTAICKGDIGAPLFRGDSAAVVGVTSNYTMFDATKPIPVTVHHTRVDSESKIGAWLDEMGVKTTNSCSKAEGGCAKREFKGSLPEAATTSGTTGPSDAGTLADGGTNAKDASTDEEEEEATPGDLPNQGESSSIQEEEEEERPEARTGDAGPRKKKKAAGGCTTGPTDSRSGAGTAFILGLALTLAGARRRRQES